MKDTYHKYCTDCRYLITLLGSSGCSHVKNGHTIEDVNKETCEHFTCIWCNKKPCICKHEDFY